MPARSGCGLTNLGMFALFPQGLGELESLAPAVPLGAGREGLTSPVFWQNLTITMLREVNFYLKPRIHVDGSAGTA